MQEYEVTTEINGTVIYRSTAKEQNLDYEIAAAGKMVTKKYLEEYPKANISVNAKPIL